MEASKPSRFDNPVVMDVIKGFLHSAETLRSCRIVNKAWLKQFNRKALQKSTFIGLERIVLADPEDLGFRTLRLDEEESEKTIQRLKVSDKVEFLQHDKVVNFFQERGNQIRFMSFQPRKNDEMSLVHLQFIENVLYKWCSNLEELQLIGLIENNVTGTVEDKDVQILSLRKLVLNYEGTSIPADNIRMSVVRKLFEFAKNLDSFVFVGYQFDPTLEYISMEIVRLLSDHTSNLTTMELCDVPVGEEEITIMTRAEFRLKVFIFQGLPKRSLRVRHLNLFLEAHATSLEHFHLKVHWITSFLDIGLELGVHMLPKLEVLKVAVRNVKVGISGLLGNLENLQDLTLWGSTSLVRSERVSLATMFQRKTSTSIRSLCLDQTYVDEISILTKWCPSVSKLEIEFPVKKINEFICNLNEMISTQGVLEDLKVTVNYAAMEVHNDEYMKLLVTGLLCHKFCVLKITAMHDMENLPWLRLAWIEEGLVAGGNTFFLIELEGFCIRDDEVEGIANALTGRANFTTWIGCKVIAMKMAGVMRLKRSTFFVDNVKTLSKDIVNSVREKEKINAKINSDAKNIKIW